MSTAWSWGGAQESALECQAKLSESFRKARQKGLLNLSGLQLVSIPAGAFDLISTCEEGEIQLQMFSTEELTRLDFSYNELTEAGDDSRFERFTACASLRLSHNALRSLVLPDALQALTELDVSHNGLTGVFVAGGLARLPTLTDLSVAHNRLTSLGPDLPAAMEKLNFAHNAVAELPPLAHCKRLRELLGEHNQLGALPLPLPASLAVLQLSRNKLGSGGGKSSLIDLSACSQLERVELADNALVLCPLLPADAPKLTRILSEALLLPLTSLTSLDASFNVLADVPHVLGYMKSLRRLVLEGNPIRPSALAHSLFNPVMEGGSIDVDMLKRELRARGKPPNATREAGHVYSTQRPPAAVAEEPGSIFGNSRGGPLAGNRARGPVPTSDAEVLPGDMGGLHAGQVRSVASRATDAERVLDLSGKQLPRFPTAVLRQLAMMRGPKGCASALEAVSEVHVSGNNLVRLLAGQDEQAQGEEQALDADEDLWAQLAHCRTLDAAQNALSALPEVLRLLPALRKLKLSGNRIDVHLLDELLLPDGPAARPDAFLSQNNLRLLPAALLRAPALHTLVLRRNKLASLGDDSLHLGGWRHVSMPSLTYLDLSANGLADLADMPHVLANGGAPELLELDLSDNELHAIPFALGHVRSLATLLVAGNPQRAIGRKVLELGPAAVLQALRNMTPASGGGLTPRRSGPDTPPTRSSSAPFSAPPTLPRESAAGAKAGAGPSTEERAAAQKRLAELSEGLRVDGVGRATMSNAKRFAVKKEIAKLTKELGSALDG
ncbi:hypothetical protein T492DRAFT_877813 [Pavlovales sp. CCMP2436]|nr:hypothetical protein T492DRAFT_877813 [Pavlovales sp. CCMP2436]